MLLKPAFSVQVAMLDRKVGVPWILVFAALAGMVALGINMWLNSQPHGTMRYGVCRTFLNMYARFPDHLVVNEVKESARQVRIEYVEMDAAGQRQTRQVECTYGPTKSGDTTITNITINRTTNNLVLREPISSEALAKFRATIPFIMAAEPDTRLPELLFKIKDGDVPSKEQLLSLQRLDESLLAK